MNVLVNETYLYRKGMSVMTEDQMNAFDGIFIAILTEKPDLQVSELINKIVKLMQLRLRKFKKSQRTPDIIEWYFKNVFGKKLSNENVMKLSNYQLAQLLLNTSFIDYDLTKIEDNLQGMKTASIQRIKEEQSTIPTKEMSQILSTVCRMNLVFLKNKSDVNVMKSAITSHLPNMNLLDIQSILSGLSIIYKEFLYDTKLVEPLMTKAKTYIKELNSLTLTNMMKS